MQNNKLLKAVRERRRFSIEDVAAASKIAAKSLAAFEVGEKEPSFKQLEKLATAYGLPVYLLAGNSIPNLPEALPDFRKGDSSPAHLSPGGARRVWRAEGVATFTRQLSSALKFEPLEIVRSIAAGSADAQVAQNLRDTFDDWLSSRLDDFQLMGNEETLFLSSLRIFLEANGIVININDADSDDFLGFYIDSEESLPLAFVNRRISSKKAQLFTLAHELCHWILGKEGVSDPFVVSNRTERKCNLFAAEFLAPMPAFRSSVERLPNTVREDVFELVQRVSSKSLLSRHATAIRLVEAGYISQQQLSTWERVARRRPRAEKEEEATDGFGQAHAKRIGELGYLPVYLAGKAVGQKMVDSIDVQSGMKSFRGIAT